MLFSVIAKGAMFPSRWIWKPPWMQPSPQGPRFLEGSRLSAATTLRSWEDSRRLDSRLAIDALDVGSRLPYLALSTAMVEADFDARTSGTDPPAASEKERGCLRNLRRDKHRDFRPRPLVPALGVSKSNGTNQAILCPLPQTSACVNAVSRPKHQPAPKLLQRARHVPTGHPVWPQRLQPLRQILH